MVMVFPGSARARARSRGAIRGGGSTRFLLVCGVVLSTAVVARGAPLGDTPSVSNGIETVCTGVGAEARSDARWNAYPLKIVLAGRGGQFLGAASIAVTANGVDVVSLRCDGPWVLVRLKPGKYRVTATIGNDSAVSAAYVHDAVAGRIIVRFPSLGGGISAEHKPAVD